MRNVPSLFQFDDAAGSLVILDAVQITGMMVVKSRTFPDGALVREAYDSIYLNVFFKQGAERVFVMQNETVATRATAQWRKIHDRLYGPRPMEMGSFYRDLNEELAYPDVEPSETGNYEVQWSGWIPTFNNDVFVGHWRGYPRPVDGTVEGRPFLVAVVNGHHGAYDRGASWDISPLEGRHPSAVEVADRSHRCHTDRWLAKATLFQMIAVVNQGGRPEPMPGKR